MNIKKLWNEILALTREAGVEDVGIRFVDEGGALVERQTTMKVLTEESLDDGITLETGETVFPNPTTAIFNPFLQRPVISFICDIKKRPFDPIYVADDEDSSIVPSIFPVIVAGRPALGSDIVPSSLPLSTASSVLSFPAGFDPQPLQPQQQQQQQQQQAAAEETITSQPERAYRGTSCHQCKNARSLDHLAFCSNLFNRRSRQDKRHCRKKYCDGCLAKCYGDSIANSKRPGWICPSCAGICRCAACTRIRRKNKSEIFPPMSFGLDDNTNNLMSGGAPSMPDVIVAEETDLSVDEKLLPEGIGKSLKNPPASPLKSPLSPVNSPPSSTTNMDIADSQADDIITA